MAEHEPRWQAIMVAGLSDLCPALKTAFSPVCGCHICTCSEAARRISTSTPPSTPPPPPPPPPFPPSTPSQPPLGIDEKEPGPVSLSLQRSALRAVASLAEIPGVLADPTFAELHLSMNTDPELSKVWALMSGAGSG